MASRDVGAGENFQEAIVQAILSAKVMILVFSTHANNSSEIKKELVLAGQHGLIVIPVRVEDVVPGGAFAYELATRQWIDMFDDWEQAIDRLASRLAGVGAKDSVSGGKAAGMAADAPPVVREVSDRPRRPFPWRVAAVLAVAAVIAGIGALAMYNPGLFGFGGSRTVEPPPLAIPDGPLKRVVLYTVVDGRRITVDFSRVAGSDWVWTENNVKFNFKAITEGKTELVFYDSSRDMYCRLDLKLRLSFWRLGAATTWYTHYFIMQIE
jgi:hypothetical protein